MSYATIDALRAELGGKPDRSPEYLAKMMHPIPKAETVDRKAFILKHVAGKRVLEFGASGPMSAAIQEVASEYFGVDREDDPARGVQGFDLDDVTKSYLPSWSQTDFVRLDVIICGEVLEHLSNPGHFLQRLKTQFTDNDQHAGVAIIITVPNAFSSAGQKWIARGMENVNADHVCWYSAKTLSALLQRAGYTVGGLFWYGGDGPTAEGLIVVTE